MRRRDTITIALGITALAAGLAVMLLRDSKVGWGIVPMVLGGLALTCELLFYKLALTQRDNEMVNADTSEAEARPSPIKPLGINAERRRRPQPGRRE